ncbi:arf-GAP with coiled-coil, ANK repeat and PH domain-containing protein 2 isoform X2, partial [Silurus asotus]
LMCELGNELINQIYEARRGELCWRKPHPGDSRQEIEAYIRAKYVERRFVRKQDPQEQISKIMMLSKHDKHLKGSVEFLPPRPPPPTPRIHPSSKSSAPLSGQEARRDSLFCPDELDSLFSYFDTSSKLRSLKSADSGIHTSTDGSREMLNSSSNTSLSEPDVQEAEPVHESPPLPPSVVECSPSLLLYWASCASSLSDMVEALALGADVNWAHGEDQRRTALMQAVQGGSLLPCEFLLQNSANVDQQDARGRGALHHAAMLGHTGQVCLFLKRGGSHSASDMDGRSPLSIAMDTTNADIVTMYRKHTHSQTIILKNLFIYSQLSYHLSIILSPVHHPITCPSSYHLSIILSPVHHPVTCPSSYHLSIILSPVHHPITIILSPVYHPITCPSSYHLSIILSPVHHPITCLSSYHLSIILSPVYHPITCPSSYHLSIILSPVHHPITCLSSYHLSIILSPVYHPITCPSSYHLSIILSPVHHPITCPSSYHLSIILSPVHHPITCLSSYHLSIIL